MLVPDLEVFNFGLPASGPDQHYLLFQHYVDQINHDAVMIAVCVENIRRVVTRFRHFIDERGQLVLYEKPIFKLVGDQLELHSSPPARKPVDELILSAEERRLIYQVGRFPRLRGAYKRITENGQVRRALVKSGLKDRFQSILSYQPLPEYEDPSNDAWCVLQAILLTWVAASSRPVIITPLPLLHYVLGISRATSYRRRFAEVAQTAGAIFVDPLELLQSYPQSTRRQFFFAEDCHPTVAGHEALARALAPAVIATLEIRARRSAAWH